MYEVLVGNAATIYPQKVYPTLTEYGVEKGYNNIEIDYFDTAVQRLYKIGDGEWQEYQDKKIRLELGETIYTKSIDKNETESQISSYTASISDSLPIAAFDGSTSTSIGGRGGLNVTYTLMVDKNMNGKSIVLDNFTYGYNVGTITVMFYNETTSISSSTINNASFRTNSKITIPEGTTNIKIRLYAANNSYYVHLYEVGS